MLCSGISINTIQDKLKKAGFVSVESVSDRDGGLSGIASYLSKHFKNVEHRKRFLHSANLSQPEWETRDYTEVAAHPCDDEGNFVQFVRAKYPNYEIESDPRITITDYGSYFYCCCTKIFEIEDDDIPF